MNKPADKPDKPADLLNLKAKYIFGCKSKEKPHSLLSLHSNQIVTKSLHQTPTSYSLSTLTRLSLISAMLGPPQPVSATLCQSVSVCTIL